MSGIRSTSYPSTRSSKKPAKITLIETNSSENELEKKEDTSSLEASSESESSKKRVSKKSSSGSLKKPNSISSEEPTPESSNKPTSRSFKKSIEKPTSSLSKSKQRLPSRVPKNSPVKPSKALPKTPAHLSKTSLENPFEGIKKTTQFGRKRENPYPSSEEEDQINKRRHKKTWRCRSNFFIFCFGWLSTPESNPRHTIVWISFEQCNIWR